MSVANQKPTGEVTDDWIINRPVDSIEVAIEAFRNGRPIIVMDDEDRENEGDIIIPAQDVTEEIMAMIINETTGILCAPMMDDRADQLGFHPMLAQNADPKGTAFTVTTDLKPTVPLDSGLIPDLAENNGETGLTTGVSALDRMKTFNALAHPKARMCDFNRPGHIFPLRAKRGGVLERRGHTEASVDLCRLANKVPVGVIGELVNEDGSMKRMDDCKRLAYRLNMPIVTIEDLVDYLMRKPISIRPPQCNVVKVAECTIPVTKKGKFLGEWKMMCFREGGHHEHIVMVLGDVNHPDNKAVPLRIHSECFTGDLLGSMRCDCGDQLTESFLRIAENGFGLIIYLTGHEGRGIGLVNKMHAYNLQTEQGLDTYTANKELGFEADLRNFDACVEIIKSLGIKDKTIHLLTNNVRKQKAFDTLKKFIKVECKPLQCEHNQFNRKYLTDKSEHEKALATQPVNSSLPENIRAALRLSDRQHLRLLPTLRIAVIKTVWFGAPLTTLQSEVAKTMHEAGIEAANVVEVVVPGASHLPFAAMRLADTGSVDAILCLGITLKGEAVPEAFSCLSSVVANGLTKVQIERGTPVLFGVLACDTEQQVVNRCGDKEVAYSLALSTVQAATEHRKTETSPLNPLPAFLKTVSEGSKALDIESARNKEQSKEIITHIRPNKEVAKDLSIVVVYALWNQSVVEVMVNDIIKTFIENEVPLENIKTLKVPGTFDIPYAVSLAAQHKPDVIITSGVLTKDKTATFEYVSLSEELSTVDIELQYNIPVVSGVVLGSTTEHILTRAKETPRPLALSALHLATLSRDFGGKTISPAERVFPSFESFDEKFLQAAEAKREKLGAISFPEAPDCLKCPTKEVAATIKVGIVRTAWNENIVEALQSGIVSNLMERGVQQGNIIERVVPGSYELASGAMMLAQTEDVDIIFCLGILIKGDTKHFEYICKATTYGLLRIEQVTGIPLTYGVLPCFSVEQSKEKVTRGSGLHEALATSGLHMALLRRDVPHSVIKKNRRDGDAADLETRTLPPMKFRPALSGELVKDIPRTLRAPTDSEARTMTIAVVATAHEEIELVQQMVDGIIEVLQAAGLPNENIVLQWVPVSFDLTSAVCRVLEETNVSSVIALGVLIEENGAQFDTSCEAASYGLLEASIKSNVPVLFGVLTCHTNEQAVERAAAGSELHYSLGMSALHMGCMRRGMKDRSGTTPKRPLALTPPRDLKSKCDASKLRVCLVRTAWNENQVLSIVELLRGNLLDAGVKLGHIVEEIVPGTFELPYISQKIADSGTVDVICLLGAIVNGDVANYEYMAAASVRGYCFVSTTHKTPIVWGVKCVDCPEEMYDVDPAEVQLLTDRILESTILEAGLH